MSRLRLINKDELDDYDKYDKYEKDIKDLNDIQSNLNSLIYNQKEKLVRIEDNISNVDNNVIESNKDLIIASKYYYSYMPIVFGGIIGGFTMTPLGLALGLKSSVLLPSFTTIGTILGGITGYKLQKHN